MGVVGLDLVSLAGGNDDGAVLLFGLPGVSWTILLP